MCAFQFVYEDVFIRFQVMGCLCHPPGSRSGNSRKGAKIYDSIKVSQQRVPYCCAWEKMPAFSLAQVLYSFYVAHFKVMSFPDRRGKSREMNYFIGQKTYCERRALLERD